MVQVHHMFFHYKEFPLSVRVLYTSTLLILGLAYLFGMVHVYNSHAGRDGRPGLTADDLAIAYSGSKEATKLEAALLGPMSRMLPTDERGRIVGWVRRGTAEQEYEAEIKPILDKRCTTCHDGSNPHIPDLSDYDKVAETAELDTGMDLFTLVRVSHIHLFGLTFIFFIMGLIFSHAFVRPVWFKAVVVAAPFAAIFFDICSWYLTKLNPAFAWLVLIAGALMGTSFAIQWTVSIYQIWLSKYLPSPRPREATTE